MNVFLQLLFYVTWNGDVKSLVVVMSCQHDATVEAVPVVHGDL